MDFRIYYSSVKWLKPYIVLKLIRSATKRYRNQVERYLILFIDVCYIFFECYQLDSCRNVREVCYTNHKYWPFLGLHHVAQLSVEIT